VKIEQLKDFYIFELSRMYNFRASLSFPVTLFSILITVCATYIKQYMNTLTPSLFFTLSLGGALLLLAISFGIFITAVLDRTAFKLTAGFTQILEYKKQLQDYYANKSDSAILVKADYEKYIEKALIEVIDFNHNQNTKRESKLSKCVVFLIATAMLLGVCSIPYFLSMDEIKDKIHKVELIVKE